MMKRHACYCSLALVALMAWATIGHAALIPVPNGDFETYTSPPGEVSPGWSNAGNLFTDNEVFTRNPNSFVLGWQSNGPADNDDGNHLNSGKWGLQQPRSDTGTGQLFYQRSLPAGTSPPGNLLGAFNGNFIGFINMDDVDGFDQEVQSGVLGNLQAGTYTLKVAVGARANANWNDIQYDTMLVSNPIDTGDLGTAGGTVLGTPATVTMVVLGTQPDTTNIVDLMYTLTVDPSHPNRGDPFAIRIAAHNTFMQQGNPDTGAPINGGTNARFAQANFDNVRLQYIPEPGSLALALGSAMGLVLAARRSRRA
ncbi:MAG: hypothetical protein WD738_04925 [Pirellulales bacterium]